jgi:NADP-dependent 3-hydroxy acid dehydrogenase YdfG
MASSDQTSSTTLVTGASRGFGRAITSALHAQGAKVVAVARNAELLASLRHELGGTLTTEAANVADPVVAGTVIGRYQPDTLVLNAGAPPLLRPLQHHTWESFSREARHSVAAVIFEGDRRHRESSVDGEQSDQRVDVAGLVGAGELGDKSLLGG